MAQLNVYCMVLYLFSTDTSLKDGLFHEFKKHGKVTSVQIHGASEERYGLVFFRQQEDQEKAQVASKGKLFFGMLIEVIAWNGPGKFWLPFDIASWRDGLSGNYVKFILFFSQRQKAKMSSVHWTRG